MSSPLQSFLPYHIASDLLRHPDESPLDREQRFEAVVLFADVSGFTALSEALGALGNSGTEELTRILNRYFDTMISLIHAYGGIIGKFGGDSMTILFPCLGDEPHEMIAHRAVQCALDMQLKMQVYERIETGVGEHGIRMKSGLAAGPVFCTTVGDPAIRLEYIIAGAALDHCADAEHHAQSGQTVIHRRLSQAASEIIVHPLDENFHLVEGIRSRVPKKPLAHLPAFSPQVSETAAKYIHPSIAKRIQREQFGFINEHRKVTTLFARFTRFDENDPKIHHSLQGYLSQVIRVIDRYDGSLNKVDMGDKGSKFIALFGAPIAHEDDAERALRCALELRAIPGPVVGMGISTGFVFSGQVGSDTRREYTVMGDAVNLAARLMQAADEGQILVSRKIYAETSLRFDWGEMRRLHIKGKTRPEQTYPLQGLRTQSKLHLLDMHYTLPMIGRQTELQIAAERIQEAVQGSGQVLGITGSPGMGKTRLAAEVIRKAMEAGMTGLGGECISHGTQSAYLVWQSILSALFNLDAAQSTDEKIRILETKLGEINPLFPNRAPLLAPAIGLPIPDNDLTRNLNPKLRKESLEALIVDCIRVIAAETSLLIVLEDCHWIDPLSADLLALVERSTKNLPVMILEIYRLPSDTPDAVPISHPPGFYEIRLTEFTEDEASLLILSKLARLYGAQSSASEALVERISKQTQGNPFYIDEIINYLYASGLELSDLYTLENFALPGSLHSLILSYIDQLTEGAKTTLKISSVIGRTFKSPWLWGIYPKLGTPERVLKQLDELRKLNIVPVQEPNPEQEYFFRHILTRDVAYENISLETRTRLHEFIGKYIEIQYSDQTAQLLDLLAYHYGLSENIKKQRDYFLQAGEAAQQRYDNQVALQYYRRLLDILDEPDQPPVLIKVSDVLQLIGDWNQAEQNAVQAMEIARQNKYDLLEAQGEQRVGAIWRLQGRFDEAKEHLISARQTFERLDDLKGVNECINNLGLIAWNQGNLEQALTLFHKMLHNAQKIDFAQDEYRASGNMGLVYWYQGKYDEALRSMDQARNIAERISDRIGTGRVTGNIGNIYLDLGKYTKAFAAYNAYLHTSAEIGYREGINIASGNLGTVYVEQGEHQNALACFTFNLKIAHEMEDPIGVGMALWYLGETFMRQGQFGRSADVLKKATAIAREVDIPYELSDFLYTNAKRLSRQHDYDAAFRNTQEALKVAKEVDNPATAFKARVLATRLEHLLQRRDLNDSLNALRSLLAASKSNGLSEKEEAAIHYTIWQMDPAQDESRTRAAALYRQLYASSPNIQYQRRHEMLTGEKLDEPPPLPPLPDIISEVKIDLDWLIAQI